MSMENSSENLTDFKLPPLKIENKEQMLDYVTKHGKEIGNRAADGCEYATRIIQFYDWYTKSQDNGTFAMIAVNIEHYDKKWRGLNGTRNI